MGFHFQGTKRDWPVAVGRLPDGAVIKQLDYSNILAEAKGINPNLVTVYRKWFDSGQHFGGSDADIRARVRDYFGQAARQIGPHVDYVEEYNEFMPWTLSEQEMADRIRHIRIACDEWERNWRHKWPQAPKLILANQFVWNDIPREVAEIAVEYDYPIGYHAYVLCQNGSRAANDWVDCSGRWHFMEQRWGLEPTWFFGETGPFGNWYDGWRVVLNDNPDLLVAVMRDVIRDWKSTPAYKRGDIIGWAQFTVGSNDWPHYELDWPELGMLADMIREEWQPPAQPEPSGTVTTTRRWNLRIDPVLTSSAIIRTMPAGSTFDAAGTVQGDDWRGNTTWQRVYCYLHSDGVRVEGRQPARAAKFAFSAFPTDYKYVTQSYGARPEYYAKFGLSGHEGIDLRAPTGTPIRAVADGTVVEVDDEGAYGKHVVIQHPEGYRTLYAHMSSVDVVQSQVVSAGDKLGESGATGNTKEAHLHLNLYQHDGGAWQRVDPTPYLLPFKPKGYV